MTIAHDTLTDLAKAVLTPFSSDATLKLFIVMILTPVCFNVFQFWMVDNFIKKQGPSTDDSAVDMELDGSMRTRIQHESGLVSNSGSQTAQLFFCLHLGAGVTTLY